MHGEGGSIVQQASGYSERVATVLPVYYPKKGNIKLRCMQWGSLWSWETCQKKYITWASMPPYWNDYLVYVWNTSVLHYLGFIWGLGLHANIWCTQHTYIIKFIFKPMSILNDKFFLLHAWSKGPQMSPYESSNFSQENMPPDSLGIDNL